jgi:hypothetical protein
MVFACVVSCSVDPALPHDAGLDAEVVPIDAAACGNGNPGSGICRDSAGCPPEDPCWRYRCEIGPDGLFHCVSEAKDGGL